MNRFLALVLLSLPVIAMADTNLALVCDTTVAEGAPIASCTAQAYRRPSSTDKVRSAAVGETDSWQSGFAYRTFSTLVDAQLVEVCSTDRPSGTIPVPWSTAVDACKAWAMIPKSQVIAATPSAPANAVTTTAPATVTVTWSPVTQNTDGSAATITGYRIYYGTATPLSTYVSVTGTTGTLANLPAGNYQVGVTALAGTAESVLSALLAVTVTAAPTTTPTGPVVTATPAYQIALTSNNKITLTQVGTVPLGTACDATQSANGMLLVDRAKVALTAGTSRPRVIVARCQ